MNNKFFSTIVVLAMLFTFVTPIYAEEAHIEIINEGLVTLSYEDASNINPEEEIQKLDRILKKQYYQTTGYDMNAAVSNYNNSETTITPFSASFCWSQCEQAYRSGISSGSDGDATAYTTFYGYYWNNGVVHWTGVGGATAGFWEGGGTAQFMQINHTVTFSTVTASITPAPGFNQSGTTTNYNGAYRYNTNYHQSSFAGASAWSSLYLGSATHSGEAYIRSPWGSDYRAVASVTID